MEMKDEIEVKFLKSILGYESEDIKERHIMQNLNCEAVNVTLMNFDSYVFSNSIHYFKLKTENFNHRKEECRLFFNPWFAMGLHFVMYLAHYDQTPWDFFAFSYIRMTMKLFRSMRRQIQETATHHG